jgi:glutamine cyclotransferase
MKLSFVTNSVWQGCRNRAIFLLFILGVSSSFGQQNQILEVINKIPHSGYSEGLDFSKGYLWHALPKEILKIDPKDGSVLERFAPATEYSESLKWSSGSLWNLSFSDEGVYQGQLKKNKIEFKKVASMPEPRGWGIEQIGSELVMTGNFSNKLYFFNPTQRKWVRTLVTEGIDLEDLAWDGKTLWTSSFSTNPGTIFSINLKSGKIESYWELPQKDQCPVIDGIASDQKTLWITGKECPSIYQVKIPHK